MVGEILSRALCHWCKTRIERFRLCKLCTNCKHTQKFWSMCVYNTQQKEAGKMAVYNWTTLKLIYKTRNLPLHLRLSSPGVKLAFNFSHVYICRCRRTVPKFLTPKHRRTYRHLGYIPMRYAYILQALNFTSIRPMDLGRSYYEQDECKKF